MLPLLSYAEHYRAVRPSSLLGAYLFTTLFFDIAHTRTLWLQQNSSALVAVTTASVLVKVTLLIAESIEKRRLLLPKYLAISPPEATAGFFNRLFFVWLNGLFRRGFSKYFQVEDLFVLDKHLSSEYLGHVVRSAWAKGIYSSQPWSCVSCMLTISFGLIQATTRVQTHYFSLSSRPSSGRSYPLYFHVFA